MTKTELIKKINDLGNEIDYMEEIADKLKSAVKDLRRAWEDLPEEVSDIEEDDKED